MSVLPDNLSGFPGAPFSTEAQNAAWASIQQECGWHIAPKKTETLYVESSGGRSLLLPTMRLLSITEIRITDTDEVIDGWWDHDTLTFRAGVVTRPKGWPTDELLAVDLEHGYETVPDELLAAVADRARSHKTGGRVVQESLGSRSVTLQQSSTGGGGGDPLAPYRIPGRL